MKVYLTGRIQSRQYQKKIDDETSETRTAFEISISQISIEDNVERVLDILPLESESASTTISAT